MGWQGEGEGVLRAAGRVICACMHKASTAWLAKAARSYGNDVHAAPFYVLKLRMLLQVSWQMHPPPPFGKNKPMQKAIIT